MGLISYLRGLVSHFINCSLSVGGTNYYLYIRFHHYLRTFLFRFCQKLMFRIFYLLYLVSKYYLLYLLAKRGLYKTPPEKLLKKFFEKAGGSFIKFGQLLSLRVDVLPKNYSIELLNLFDNVGSFSYKEVEHTFLQELGTTPQKLFKDFQKEPFASASFGQMHAAKLENSQVVAIKVMRPGMESMVQVDFFLIGILAFFADIFFKIDALPWKEFAGEFKKWTAEELDYRLEADRVEKVAKNLKNSPLIVVPKVYKHLSTKRILVEDYIEGYPLSRVLIGLRDGRLDHEKLSAMGINIKETPRTLTREILRQLFFDGIFHADPHPGNILLLKNDKVGLIDFGIVGEGIVHNKMSFVKTLKAFANMDFEEATYNAANYVGDNLKTMVNSALPASVSQEHIDKFMEILASHFSKSVKKIVEGNRKNLEVMKKDYTGVFLEILNSARKYRIKVPKELVVVIRTLTIMGYLAKELDYEFRLTDETKKFFKEFPEEVILEEWDQYSPYKRIGRERAVESLNGWLDYIAETDHDLYSLVKQHISQYNHY